ncbi:hypothetical protein HMPREF0201_03015 [Cedecea davisae DSM 4568]|uniref:Uncharacterized protein n=1 Tax=Cedecea davisae DSM 4568 TaxID=566551 RepID=S3IS20_9ENTR|nr:hypothetical protein HMPREF0201_03015 [Cedecea davisae DSM 4568]
MRLIAVDIQHFSPLNQRPGLRVKATPVECRRARSKNELQLSSTNSGPTSVESLP